MDSPKEYCFHPIAKHRRYPLNPIDPPAAGVATCTPVTAGLLILNAGSGYR